MTSYRIHSLPLLFLALLPLSSPVSAQEDLAKESQNPIGNLISLPFVNDTNFGVGSENAVENVFSIKPVYPVNLGEWNLINRAILPVIYQGETMEGEGSQSGLGDFTYQRVDYSRASWKQG